MLLLRLFSGSVSDKYKIDYYNFHFCYSNIEISQLVFLSSCTVSFPNCPRLFSPHTTKSLMSIVTGLTIGITLVLF